MSDLTGGCACGKIRYRVTADPILRVICYCQECRRTTGALASPIVAVPRAGFELTSGEPAHREYEAESGARARHLFCRDCGCAIGGGTSSFPDLVTLRLGSFDEPPPFEADMQVFVEHAPKWLPIPEQGRRFARGPEGVPG